MRQKTTRKWPIYSQELAVAVVVTVFCFGCGPLLAIVTLYFQGKGGGGGYWWYFHVKGMGTLFVFLSGINYRF